MLRFELARQYPELLAKLDEQAKKENQEYIKFVAKHRGLKIKFPDDK